MEDIGEIFTVVVTLAVTVLGFILKAKDSKSKRLIRKVGDEQEPVREDATPSTGRSHPVTKPAEEFEEGQRMFETLETESPALEKKPKKKKIKIDKKNLILYSEIMKPKFDE